MQWQSGEFVITIGKFDDLNLTLRGWVGWGVSWGKVSLIKECRGKGMWDICIFGGHMCMEVAKMVDSYMGVGH